MFKKIIFTSGGTGGHIFPAMNLMKYFDSKKIEVLLVTDAKGNKFLKKNTNFRSIIISASTPTNKNIFNKILSYISIFFSVIKSIIILKKEKPNVIFGSGGFVSFPICLASVFFKIPLMIYENNLVLGRANKILLPFCNKILLGSKVPINFPDKYKHKIKQIGYILSDNIIKYSPSKKKKENNIFSILVLGGSQGAEIFGKLIPPVIKFIKEKGYNVEITQQCTKFQKEEIEGFYNQNNIKNNIFDFTDNIVDLLSSTSLAISRCGASTLAELAYTGTPFIAIPLPNSIDNHQYLNAKFYEEEGSCWVIEQHNISFTTLSNLVIKIIEDKKTLKSMRENIKKNNNKNVYIKIKELIEEFV